MNLPIYLDHTWFYVRRFITGDSSPADYVKLALIRQLSMIYKTINRKQYPVMAVPINKCAMDETDVGQYWGEYTVNSRPFSTRWESRKYYEWLLKVYPLLDELMDFDQNRSDQVILDYGCGPGNDLFRFLIINNAKKVIGLDLSLKAMELARQRLSLYKINPDRLELIQCSDAISTLPVSSESIDHINCAGVLHHTVNPEKILNEFYRVLKKGSSGNIMVYNEDSIFYHLYVAYRIMIIQNRYGGMSSKDAFSRCTDGEDCPIAKCYKSDEFNTICRAAGFDVDYLGGYFDRLEPYFYKEYSKKAMKDQRLAKEHKDFLSSLKLDRRGYPKFQGKYAGIGGVYKIYKK
jgi:ubiquinone/menaquinone biosynthesis C-methylase UbiE